jgi:hypothetical protein
MTFQEIGDISVAAYYKGLENQSQFKESVANDTLVSVEKQTPKGTVRNDSYRATFVPQVTWYRWLILALFIVNLMVMSGESLSFSPVSVQIAQAFGVDVLYIIMCSVIFTLTSIPMSFVAIFLFNRFNSAWILRLGAFFLLAGNWLRLAWKATDSFAPVLMG